MYKQIILLLLCAVFVVPTWAQQTLTAQEIIQKMDDNIRGLTSYAEIKMTIVRPTWTREMQLKSWSKGTEMSMMLITAPARDKGTATLMRDKEIWTWQPKIDRTIKLPPSMMLQSWMGSDFTNDDLVKQSSAVVDYTHEIVGSETIEGYECYKIVLTPKPDAPVVWGKLISWIDKKYYMQLKAEFYDEDDYLVNTMRGSNVQQFSGKYLPAKLEIIPAEEEGNKTIMEYLKLKFNEPFKDSFFSIQSMKRLR